MYRYSQVHVHVQFAISICLQIHYNTWVGSMLIIKICPLTPYIYVHFLYICVSILSLFTLVLLVNMHCQETPSLPGSAVRVSYSLSMSQPTGFLRFILCKLMKFTIQLLHVLWIHIRMVFDQIQILGYCNNWSALYRVWKL